MADRTKQVADTSDAADRGSRFLNRELSWLEFNDRVLREGMNDEVPLLERLKFLAIVSSNLDEFFMIRVAGLKQKAEAGVRTPDPAGLTPAEQLEAISRRVHRMVDEQSDAIAAVFSALREEGIALLAPEELNREQQEFVSAMFKTELAPVLTPLAVGELSPAPLIPGLRLHLALLLAADGEEDEEGAPRLAFVPVPGGLPRFVTLPAEEGMQLIRLEDVVGANASALFGGRRIEACCALRITRDADVAVDETDAADLADAMEQAVRERTRRSIVRLSLSARAPERLRRTLIDWAGAHEADVYDVDGVLDAAALMEIAGRPGFDRLKYDDWPPQTPRDLLGADDLWGAIRERDVLLVHPYESFDPVVQLVEAAAGDPNVLAIKQTLYRTSGDSPIVRALERAAQNGKQVTVLVELKARFDEAKNVNWARRLEDAGCYVIYGIAGYKTHAKALLIVRREARRVRRYVHLSTGNYNDRTARLYSDIGLMTGDADLTSDAAAFFNLLTGYSQSVGWTRFTIAPTELRHRLDELIEREIRSSTPEDPGLIMAKVNSLQDPGIIEMLYRASQAGVRIRLNVRGICCLRPGVEGLSETIEVVSIVDRFLEHARIFYFHNGGHDEVYLASADWMTRNIDRRLELMFPVQQGDLKSRLTDMLRTYLSDNVKARRLNPDGSWSPVPDASPPCRAQETLYRRAVEAARDTRRPPTTFRPLTAPRE